MKFAKKESYQTLQDNFERLGIKPPDSQFGYHDDYDEYPLHISLLYMQKYTSAYSLDELIDILPPRLVGSGVYHFLEIGKYIHGSLIRYEMECCIESCIPHLVSFECNSNLTQSACNLVNWVATHHEKEFIKHMKGE